jgi:hypothetical protein
METAIRDSDAIEVENKSRCAMWSTIRINVLVATSLSSKPERETSEAVPRTRLDRTRSRTGCDPFFRMFPLSFLHCACFASVRVIIVLALVRPFLRTTLLCYPPRTWMWNHHHCQHLLPRRRLRPPPPPANSFRLWE